MNVNYRIGEVGNEGMPEQTILITGSTDGIGMNAALELARLRAHVLVHGRNRDKGQAVVDEIRRLSKNNRVDMLIADLASRRQVHQLAGELLRRYGRIDVLINNAGVFLRRRQVTEDGLEMTFAVNHLAPFLLTNLLLERLKQSAPARIINVTSVVAETGNPGQVNYVAAKAGLIGLTRALALEIASRNITVNAVAPGFIVSAMTDSLPQNVKDALLARVPLGRMGCDAEIAAAIVFLASEEAGYITGAVLDVNGGLRMG